MVHFSLFLKCHKVFAATNTNPPPGSTVSTVESPGRFKPLSVIRVLCEWCLYVWWRLMIGARAPAVVQAGWWWVTMVESQSQWLPSWDEYWWGCWGNGAFLDLFLALVSKQISPKSHSHLRAAIQSEFHLLLTKFWRYLSINPARGRRKATLSWYTFFQYSTGFSCNRYSFF